MGGRGSASRLARGSGTTEGWQEAFEPGRDYVASGDVDHESRSVSYSLRSEWRGYADDDVSSRDREALDKDCEYVSGKGVVTYGYVRTFNSFKINEALYNPENAGKTDEEIFTRRDNAGRLRDLETVRTLDRMIDTHATKNDGTYSRYTSAESIKSTFGFTDEQMNLIAKAGIMDSANLKKLGRILSGRTGYSRAYTSTSANRSMNAFRDKNMWERRLYVREGTKAYQPANNAQESETIFGRHMNTRIIGLSVEGGKIVIHEAFDGYRKR